MKTLLRASAVLLLALSPTVSLAAAGKTYQIAVIPKGATHEFWKSVHAGALKAQRELAQKGIRIEILWKGPLKEDDRDQQIQVVENFMTRRVDGIVLAPLDSQALVAPVVNATKTGIPVVIIDSDLKSDKHISFVATDNYRGGCLAAEQLAKLLDGRGNVVMLRYAVGSASTEQREAGFLDTVGKHPGLKLISSDQYGGPTRETAYQASQNLLNRYGRDVNGVFAPNETTTIGMTKAVRDLGKGGGKVKMVGFDANAQSLQDLRQNDLQGIVVQNPFRMGYDGTLIVMKHLQGQPVEKRVDTGVTLVTLENLEQPAIKELIHPPLDQYLK
jgi:ribose transport system substrate-binding protein